MRKDEMNLNKLETKKGGFYETIYIWKKHSA